jgi:DNA polymerase III epsilon subunit-like protein
MNFYLDFEASRFSNRIISIGCISQTGNTFQTYVKPGKEKVDYFITELTGITNEMLSDAPDADVAFMNLFRFICSNNADNGPPAYYVYGNSDAEFIKSTLTQMNNTVSCMCAQSILGNLIDYSAVVKKFFASPQDLALCKVYMLIQGETNLTQSHDALEDAIMLKTVVSQLYNKCNPNDKETILSMPSQHKPSIRNKHNRPVWMSDWNNIPKWQANTYADEGNWVIRCVDKVKNQIKYFNSVETATYWVIKYIANNVSPRNPEAVQRVQSAILGAIKNKNDRYNCFWEYSPEGALKAVAQKE